MKSEKCNLVSIITVVYNAEKVIEKTLESIINQTCKDIELIIIDGKSTDSTLKIVNRYAEKVSYLVSEKDNGIYDAMNKGLKAAKGEYVTFLNAGDYYCDSFVLENLFNNSPKADIVYGDMFIEKDSITKPYYQRSLAFEKEELLKHGTRVVCHQAIFVKTAIAPQYDIQYKYKAELNWYFDIVESQKELHCHHVPIPVVYYTLGGYGWVNYKWNLLEWVKLVYKRYGISTLIKYKYHSIVIKKLIYRYGGILKFIFR